MKKELQDRLTKEFPLLYQSVGKRGRVMIFGFDVGDGWYQLIRNLSARLVALNAGIVAVQVKSKFGGLRFYVNGIPANVAVEGFKLIEEAERKSVVTCELCGKSGKVISDEGWISIRCNECVEKNKNKNKKKMKKKKKTRKKKEESYQEGRKDAK